MSKHLVTVISLKSWCTVFESRLEEFMWCLSRRTMFSLSERPSDVDVVSSSEQPDEIISSRDDTISSGICASRITHSSSSSLTQTCMQIAHLTILYT